MSLWIFPAGALANGVCLSYQYVTKYINTWWLEIIVLLLLMMMWVRNVATVQWVQFVLLYFVSSGLTHLGLWDLKVLIPCVGLVIAVSYLTTSQFSEKGEWWLALLLLSCVCTYMCVRCWGLNPRPSICFTTKLHTWSQPSFEQCQRIKIALTRPLVLHWVLIKT